MTPGRHLVLLSNAEDADWVSVTGRLLGLQLRDSILIVTSSGVIVALLFRVHFEGTLVKNLLTQNEGGLNIDECRIPTDDVRSRPPRTPNTIYGGGKGTNRTAYEGNPKGRWPSNAIFVATPSPEVSLLNRRSLEDTVLWIASLTNTNWKFPKKEIDRVNRVRPWLDRTEQLKSMTAMIKDAGINEDE